MGFCGIDPLTDAGGVSTCMESRDELSVVGMLEILRFLGTKGTPGASVAARNARLVLWVDASGSIIIVNNVELLEFPDELDNRGKRGIVGDVCPCSCPER